MCFVRSANRCSMWSGVGPYPAGDQLLVEVGQVHEGGEVVAQSDRVDDREADLAGRHATSTAATSSFAGRRPRGRGPSPPALSSKSERCGNGSIIGSVNSVCAGEAAASSGTPPGMSANFTWLRPKGTAGGMAVGCVQRLQSSGSNRGKSRGTPVRNDWPTRGTARCRSPTLRHFTPLALESLPALFQGRVVPHANPLRFAGIILVELAEQRRVFLLDPLEHLIAPDSQFGQSPRKLGVGPLLIDLAALFDPRRGGGKVLIGLRD